MTPEWLAQNELCQHGERRKFCALCVKLAPISHGKDCCCSGCVQDRSIEWPEHMIEAECTKLLEQDGWRALRTDPVSDRGKGKGFGELGMADHLYLRYNSLDSGGVVRDQVLWIEFKSAKGKPAKHQIEWHTKERARGALTWIAGVDFPPSIQGFVMKYRQSGLNRGRV
jgi:hypothetical protein